MSAIMGYSEHGVHALAQVVAKIQPNRDIRILDCAAGAGHGGMQVNRFPPHKRVKENIANNVFLNFCYYTHGFKDCNYTLFI